MLSEQTFYNFKLCLSTKSNRFSSSTSPMRIGQAFALGPSTSTPDLADDEDSEGEPDGVLQRIPDLHRFNSKFFTPGIQNN